MFKQIFTDSLYCYYYDLLFENVKGRRPRDDDASRHRLVRQGPSDQGSPKYLQYRGSRTLRLRALKKHILLTISPGTISYIFS
jgi:hypothetical protein